LFLNSPTNSFFLVSTEMTGCPRARNCRACWLRYWNGAFRSGGARPSLSLRLAYRLYPSTSLSSRPTMLGATG
jgi:hypothetical protein